MKNLTPKQINKIIAKLKLGIIFNNGLIGYTSYEFKGNNYIVTNGNTTENKSFIYKYSEKEFRLFLAGYPFSDREYFILIAWIGKGK